MKLPVVFKAAVNDLEAQGHQVEDFHVSTTRDGHRTCEVACNDGRRRIFMCFTDSGTMIEQRTYTLRGWSSREERNREIQRLYRKERMTQEFIAKIMGLSQSRISQIVQA